MKWNDPDCFDISLQLIVKHSFELQESLQEGLDQTPSQCWRAIIPQLFSRLNHPVKVVRNRISDLLCRIAEGNCFHFSILAADAFAPVSFSDFDNLFINCKLIFMRSWLYDYIASWNKLFLISRKDEFRRLISAVKYDIDIE